MAGLFLGAMYQLCHAPSVPTLTTFSEDSYKKCDKGGVGAQIAVVVNAQLELRVVGSNLTSQRSLHVGFFFVPAAQYMHRKIVSRQKSGITELILN